MHSAFEAQLAPVAPGRPQTPASFAATLQSSGGAQEAAIACSHLAPASEPWATHFEALEQTCPGRHSAQLLHVAPRNEVRHDEPPSASVWAEQMSPGGHSLGIEQGSPTPRLMHVP
jgi:hypothetical protein